MTAAAKRHAYSGNIAIPGVVMQLCLQPQNGNAYSRKTAMLATVKR
ncbi:hypothetical protein [Chitinophaga sp. sic0106]|nr:hypothetical protein [Chitinophaga sp. sic0106]MBV7528683.1 hypothetical protein [Chitinophaga sp. sic0106]